MRTRAEAMKEKAKQIAAGQPVTETNEPKAETKPVENESEPEQPKRRSRSSVVKGKDRAADEQLYADERRRLEESEKVEHTAGIGDVATTSQELANELEKNDEARRLRERNQAHDAEGKTAADLTMGPGYDRIITHLFQLEDPMQVYEEVRASLRMGRASAASYGQLVDALDEAAEGSMRAFDLLVNAKDAHDAFEIDAKIIMGSLRTQATALLEDQKAKGVLKKAITNDDVEAVMAANHPDEWQDIERKRGRAKRSVDLLAALHEAAREREKDLRAMVSKFRGD